MEKVLGDNSCHSLRTLTPEPKTLWQQYSMLMKGIETGAERTLEPLTPENTRVIAAAADGVDADDSHDHCPRLAYLPIHTVWQQYSMLMKGIENGANRLMNGSYSTVWLRPRWQYEMYLSW